MAGSGVNDIITSTNNFNSTAAASCPWTDNLRAASDEETSVTMNSTVSFRRSIKSSRVFGWICTEGGDGNSGRLDGFGADLRDVHKRREEFVNHLVEVGRTRNKNSDHVLYQSD